MKKMEIRNIGWHTEITGAGEEADMQSWIPTPGQLWERLDLTGTGSTSHSLQGRIWAIDPNGKLSLLSENPLPNPEKDEFESLYWVYECVAQSSPKLSDFASMFAWLKPLLPQLAPFQPLAMDALEQLQQASDYPFSLPLALEFEAAGQQRSFHLGKKTFANGEEGIFFSFGLLP